jgi:uncharacterized protein YecT (DUF1311 family)
MLRGAVPLLLSVLLAPPIVAPAVAAEPSFDCRTGKTARELATCGDARLAGADRELAAAWREATTRLDPLTAKALREDQRKFLSDIDDGFDAELWGKQDRPEGKELRTQVAQLRRGGDDDALAALEAQLRERIAFLRNLTPAASVTGLWKNHDSEFLVAAGDNGRYRATYGNTSFGVSLPLHRRVRRIGHGRQKARCAGRAQYRPGGRRKYREHVVHGSQRRNAHPLGGNPRQCRARRCRASARAAAILPIHFFTPVCAPTTPAA